MSLTFWGILVTFESFSESFASWSTFSLPVIFVWLGTHWITISCWFKSSIKFATFRIRLWDELIGEEIAVRIQLRVSPLGSNICLGSGKYSLLPRR